MSIDDWWLHIYVMLSRVRTIDQMLVYGMPDKSFFKTGPPVWISKGIQRLEEKSRQGRARVVAALAILG